MTVSVEEKYPTLPNLPNVLLSLLQHQEHKCVIEGSEHIANICVILSKFDWNRFLLKHQFNRLNNND